MQIVRSPRLALAALIGLAVPCAFGQQPVAIALQHRSAEAIILALRPQLAGTPMTATEGAIFVRATQGELPRVTQLVRMADQPLRPLQIALRDDEPSDDTPAPDEGPNSNGQALSTGGSLQSGRVGNGQVLSTGGSLQSGSVGNGQVLSTRNARGAQQILEGDLLLLSMPVSQSMWFHSRGASGSGSAARAGSSAPGRPAAPAASANAGAAAGNVDAAGNLHYEAMTDFNARIWLAGDTVAIDLRPRPAGSIDGGTPASGQPTVLYGRIGRWIELSDSGRRVVSPGGADSGQTRAGLWIRVTPLQ